MKRDVSLWQFAGFSLTALGGTLLHYAYEWTGNNPVVAVFSGVNESTWEHMKLLFWPLFAFALIQSRYFREERQFWCVKLRGITTGLVLIPTLFYTYNGALGKSPDWLNISFFFIATAVVFWRETQWLHNTHRHCRRPWLAVTLLCLIGILFIVFTFAAPILPLFRDPISGTYGI